MTGGSDLPTLEDVPWFFTFGDVLRELARSRPSQLAVVDGSVRLTYSQLEGRVNRLANWLATRVRPGDRVLWFGQNSFRALEALVASAKLGAIFCPANWRGSADEMTFVLGDLEPEVVIWQEAEIGASVRAVRERFQGSSQWVQHDGTSEDGYESLLASMPDSDQVGTVDPSAPLLAIYTAAFSGTPGAAMLSHLALLVQGLVIGRTHEVSAESVCLSSTPLFHVASFLFLNATFVHGGTNVFLARTDPESMCRVIEAERCSHAIVFPPTMEAIRAAATEGRFDVSSLWPDPGLSARSTMLTPPTAPWARRSGGYGQTEVGGLVTFAAFTTAPEDAKSGRPLPVAAVRIVAEDGREVAEGEVGEIAVRGLTTMSGYFRRETLNAERRRGGWHHTNDLGRRNADGTISFVGPKTRLIKSGSENIYPADVEARLAGHPAVAEVCVLGVPDDRWTQSVRAIVVLRPGLEASEAELIAYCVAGIASYKKPRSVMFVDELPRNAGGSVDRDAVDDTFGGGGYPGT